MPTYIVLARFTQQGMQSLKKTPIGLEMQKEAVGPAMGVKVKEIYFVTGQYDAVAILEAPNDTVLAKYVLTVGSLGNVRTETLRAFTEDEVRKLTEELP
jgi:uncharacterized protein with GYD domain